MPDTVLDSILGDGYDIQEAYLRLSREYFNEEPDTLKAGIFGYVNEIMAHSTKQAVFHRNVLYNEFFLNTAAFPETIYANSVDLGVEIRNASPSRATILLGVDAAQAYERSEGGALVMRREDLSFDMGGFRFSIPFDIRLDIQGTSLNAVVSGGRYVTDEAQSINGTIHQQYASNPFIRTLTYPEPGTAASRYAALLVDLYQVEMRITDYPVLSNNISERVSFSVTHQDQLVNFNVFYNPSPLQAGSEFRPLVKVLSFHATTAESLEEYVVYNQINEGEYRLSFPTARTRFRPEFNSITRAVTFTTRGSEGNFAFSGTVAASPAPGSVLEGLGMIAHLVDAPAGGEDRPDTLEAKRILLDKLKRVDILVTDDDLDAFFSRQAKENFGLESRVKFVRTRDDAIRREFTAFLLMADANGTPYGTATRNVSVPTSELEARNDVLPMGALVVHEPVIDEDGEVTGREHRLLERSEYPEDFLLKDGAYVYAIPYLIRTIRGVEKRAVYYRNFVRFNLPMHFRHINSSTGRNILLGDLRIERNPISTRACRLSCPASGVDEDLEENLKIVAVLSRIDTGAMLGFSELAYSDVTGLFEADLVIDDAFNSEGEMQLLGSLSAMSTVLAATPSASRISAVSIPEDLKLDIVMLFRESGASVAVALDDGTAVGQGDEVREILETDAFRSSSNFEYLAHLSPDMPVRLYENVGDVVRSGFRDKEGSSDAMVIEEVPLIDAKIFYSPRRMEAFYGAFLDYAEVIRDNLGRLKDQSDVSLKFYNSTGYSRHYDSPLIDISIDLRIRLSAALTPEIDSRIKKAVVGFVRDSNNSPSRLMAVSQMYLALQQAFPEIVYIHFDAINGLREVQEISRIFSDADIEESVGEGEYAPEFLNIACRRDGGRSGDNFVPAVRISYV